LEPFRIHRFSCSKKPKLGIKMLKHAISQPIPCEGQMNSKRRFFARVMLALLSITLLCLPVLAEKAPNIPPGTTIQVRMISDLSSEISEAGDTFQGTLEAPITVNGRDLYPKGADVTGRVADVHRSGRLSDPGELNLVLTTVSAGGLTSSLSVEPLVIKGESHTKSNVTKIGGGAALGAIVGAIAGGGKGAAIGAGVGGAAGTGVAAATGKKEARVESEAVLSFVTVSQPVAANAPPASATSTPSESPTATTAPTTTPVPDSQGRFSLRDRRVIRNCVSEHASELPAGTTQREELPSGVERQLYQGGTLPAELQSKVQSLPLACEQQLPKLSPNQERVIYKGRVMLTDSSNHILDVFFLDDTK
jgi:hypothetical protein